MKLAHKLRDYQRPHAAALYQLLQRVKRVLIADDCGLGKTYTALAIAAEMDIVPFVIGPAGARTAWEQASEIMGMPLEFVSYNKLLYVKPREDGQEETNLVDTEWITEKPWGSGSFMSWKVQHALRIFDEVHRCGGQTSNNSKALISAIRDGSYIMGLSATAADDPRQLKALGYMLGLHALNDKRTGFRSWMLRHGCVPGLWGGMDLDPDPEVMEKVFSRINAHIFPARGRRLRKQDIPGFPKTQIEVKLIEDPTGRAVKLAAELEAKYERLRAKAREDDENGPSKMEEIHRIQQELELLAIPSWLEMMDQYQSEAKVVIFVNYRETLTRLVEAAGKKFQVGYAQGGQNRAEREAMVEAFQANALDAFIANIACMGESGSLHDPTGKIQRVTGIMPCNSGRQLVQVFGRVNRDGGAFSTQFLCYFKNTVQEKVAERALQKKVNIHNLNDASLGYAEN